MGLRDVKNALPEEEAAAEYEKPDVGAREASLALRSVICDIKLESIGAADTSIGAQVEGIRASATRAVGGGRRCRNYV